MLAFAILLLTGVIAANYFGLRLIRFWEAILGRIPFVKSIYSSVKQVSDTLLSDTGNAFRKALLVEFPHDNSWTIAFLTGSPAPAVARHFGEEHVSVYVPTTPNPTSGYFVMVPKSRVRELDMTVDEALKYVVSMGVVVPRGSAVPPPPTTAPLPRRDIAKLTRPPRGRPAPCASPPRAVTRIRFPLENTL